MEGQTPYRLKSQGDLRVIQENHKREILKDDQVLDFVSKAEIGVDSSVIWFGYQISLEQSPFYRFSEILERNYSRLNPDEKSKLLANAGKFVLGGIRPAVSIVHRRSSRFSNKEYTEYEYEHLSPHSLEIRERNLGEYLLRCLEFCQEDMRKSREFIVNNVKDFDPKKWEGDNQSPLSRFYSAPKGQEGKIKRNERIKAVVDRYIDINPKIPELAFLLEADLFGFSPGLFKYLLESIFPKAHTDLKTEIMRYISQKLVNKDFSHVELVDISLFLQQNRNFYNDLKTRNPTNPLAASYDLANISLKFHNLRDKLRRKDISVDDFVNLLEENPFFAQYVSNEELEEALDVTKDHGIALRIEKIIRGKKESTPTPAVPHL